MTLQPMPSLFKPLCPVSVSSPSPVPSILVQFPIGATLPANVGQAIAAGGRGDNRPGPRRSSPRVFLRQILHSLPPIPHKGWGLLPSKKLVSNLFTPTRNPLSVINRHLMRPTHQH